MSDKRWKKIGGAQNDGLYRHAITQMIKFRKSREGKGEIDKSLKTHLLETARKLRDELMADQWGDNPKKMVRQTVREIWPAWKQAALINARVATVTSLTTSEKHLEPFIFDMFLDDVTGEWWTSTYIPRKRELTHAKRKFFNDRKWLAMFLKWCEENSKGPTGWRRPKLIDPDPPRDAGKAYTPEEYERLLDNADWSLMTKIVMGCEHFMRRSEIALMAKDRIDREKRVIYLRVQDTKIKKAREFPYSETLEWLFLILDTRPDRVDSPWLFPSPMNPAKSIGRDGFATAWSNCRKNAKVTGRFHDLRHTGLTRAFKAKDANPALICTFAGLALDEAQKTYLHFTIDDMRGVENLVGSGQRSGEIREFEQ